LQVISETSQFDLNIEEILESWEIYDGLREIISNALDEQLLTDTKEIEITQVDDNTWFVRDYGRGIHYQHLTMNENEEKIDHPNTIGKFGIGLKDALATFYRKDVECIIQSKYGDISVSKSQKHGFEEIETLHAIVSPPTDPEMIGTKVTVSNITAEDLDKAKKLFLKFSDEKLLEANEYGQILEKNSTQASNIYINGVKVAEEENFLLSYNITSLTKKIKDALNRERINVGRSAYSGRIKRILLSSENEVVAEKLVDDLNSFGDYHDEMTWLDVQDHAVRILNTRGEYLFASSQETMNSTDAIDHAKNAGMKVITIPDRLRDRVRDSEDIAGNTIRDLTEFNREYEESYEYTFIEIEDLSDHEKWMYNKKDEIFQIIGGKPYSVSEVKISETIRKDMTGFSDADGVYEPNDQTIIIKRDQLDKLQDYVGTLLHEIAHATSGRSDVDRAFELELTRLMGVVGAELLKNS